MNGNAEELNRLKQLEDAKKKLMNVILSREAHERLSRVRMVDQALAGKAELYLIQIYQSDKLRSPVTDEQLKGILGILKEDREFRIKRM